MTYYSSMVKSVSWTTDVDLRQRTLDCM